MPEPAPQTQPKKKSPFLLGQSFVRLNPNLEDWQRRIAVCGPRKEDPKLDQQEKGREEGKTQELWEEIGREEVAEMLLGPMAPKRVAVVCDAGLGKSTNMQWLESKVARDTGTSLLPLLLRLDDGSKPHLEWILEEYEEPGTLLERIKGELVHGSAILLGVEGLAKLRDAGEIALLIDGLDHAISHPKLVHNLGKLHSSKLWKNCPIWISGRPYAFEQCWKDLFADGWDFLKVKPLARPEIRQYMKLQAGGDWFEELAEAGNLLAVPRLLKLVCGILARAKLPVTENKETRKAAFKALGLNTPAEIYQKAFFEKGTYREIDTYGLLAQGLVGEAGWIGLEGGAKPEEDNQRRRIERAADLLGVIAFTLMVGSSGSVPSQPNTTGISMNDLEKALFPRVEKQGLWSVPALERDRKYLRLMNNLALDFLLFTDAGDKLWVFQDRTVQAFFAAYWLVKRGTPKDLNQVETWKRNIGYDEFWQFAAQMPAELVEKEKWIMVFEPSYRFKRSHRITLWISFLFKGVLWVERNDYQWHRRSIYWSHSNMQDWGPEIIKEWRKGSEKLKPKIDAGWRRCPKNKKLTGSQKFQMGLPEGEKGRLHHEEQHEESVAPFYLQEFVVTNGQYRRFDPVHSSGRGSNHDVQPVVNVSFWDAWCFAHWVGHRLPTEVEWEYACRAGTKTAYFYGNTADPEKMNFADTKLEKTTPKGRFEPNAWGLYDMHGNVWEWCDSLYALGASYRVLRGGGWLNDGVSCRSAYRAGNDPSHRYHDYGFRLAAVPVVGAK